MQLLQHIGELILFLSILLGPLPLCFSLICIDNNGKEKPNLPHSLLVLLTNWCFIEISIGLLLGTIKHLDLNAVLFCEFLVFIAGIILLIYLRCYTKLFSVHKLLRLSQRLSKAETLIVGVISFVGVILLERVMTLPITEYDSVNFRLGVVASFYQTSSFTWLNATDNFISGVHQSGGLSVNPNNWQVISSLFVMPFQEDFLMTFPMLISWLIWGLSVYLLSLKFGAFRFYAMAASSLVLTYPFVINLVNTMEVDIPLASFFMASLYFAISCNQNRSASEFLLFLASLGMLMGVKTPGLIYGFFLITAFAAMQLFDILLSKNDQIFYGNRFKLKASKLTLLFITIGLVLLILFGGFWYFNNLVESSHVLGIRGTTKGVNNVNNSIYSSFQTSLAYRFDPTNLEHWKTFGLQAIARLQIPFIVMSAQAFLLPLAVVIRNKRITNETIIGLLALLVSTGFLYWNTPYTTGTNPVLESTQLSPHVGQTIRYGFPFLSVLGVVAATSATITRTSPQMIVIVVWISSLLGIVTSTFNDALQAFKFKGYFGGISGLFDRLRNDPDGADWVFNIVKPVLPQIILYLGLFLLVILLIFAILFLNINQNNFFTHIYAILRQSKRSVLFSVLIGLLVTATFVAREKRDVKRHEIYGGIYEYISNDINQYKKIGYLFSSNHYILYGKEISKEVLYVPPQSDKLSEWLDDLRQRGITLVAVGPLNEFPKLRSSQVISWLENPDGSFIRVFGKDINTETILYRIKSN